MSIISFYETDNSEMLYKRYAALATSYLDHPDTIDPVAEVPLENLYRLLEMFRYDSFADDSHAGVLAMDHEEHPFRLRRKAKWQEHIQTALGNAITSSFTADVSKEEAISELENTLRSLFAKDNIKPSNKERAKRFFNKFKEALEPGAYAC